MNIQTDVKTAFTSMDYGVAPESASVAEAWLTRHDGKFGLFIGGEWRAAKHHFDSLNPATGRKLADIGDGTAADVDAAVAAARGAQPGWARLGGHGRARFLYALARLVQKHARLFAVVESMDNGKPIRETRDIDIPLVARHFYYHAGWAQLIESEFDGTAPLGVVGQVIPWNFPLLMLAWKIAPALAAGNTVVLKPAEDTSLTALLFAEICDEAGLPKGVVNIVTGAGETGKAVVEHGGIDKIAFTGSTEVGRIIRTATAGTGKKLTLELGGKSPFIVFEDADLDAAVEGAVDAIWFNQGQVCCAGSRLLVQESVAEKLYAKLRARMETLRVGDPLDKNTDIGAIVSPKQRSQIEGLVKQGVAEGAILFQPPSYKTEERCPEGCFYPPTLLTGVDAASTVAQVEIFGPVLVAMTFRTPAEAVQLANNTRYGLAASIWSDNINVALDIAPKVKAGVVWVNCTNQFDASAGFGGYRESGFGREGGREGMFEYLKRIPSGKPQTAMPAMAASDVVSNAIDRTAKLFIGGKQARPDSGYSRAVLSPAGKVVGQAGDGNRKDIRNAVEACAKAENWASTSGHSRAQILYYIAENLSARAGEFAKRLKQMTGASGTKEVEASIRRLFTYAAWADKFDGAIHDPPLRGVVLAMHEAVGNIGIACPDEAPLLGFVSLMAPAIAMGNRVVMIPSERHPLAATDFYQVLETSDVPDGVVNIVTGARDSLAMTLAEHGNVESVWYFGTNPKAVEAASAGNLKRTWTGETIAWHDNRDGEGRHFLRHATQVKNIWIPYGA
ncbi:MAG TPA: aldehyde dehydrogenase family protein [Rhizomicrobium sp.]|jgi:aldehyde dehydrogenase (NAD+)|nr:aldehyde dehydrogenase family protein [Rhizomicrobium sp.]